MLANNTLESLMDDGAKRVIPNFRVAQEEYGQDEVIYRGKRYLITPNDDAYKSYVKFMTCSKLPYLENDSDLGSEDTVVGELPRDARLLHQFARSMQDTGRMNSTIVAHMIGRSLNSMIVNCGVLPADSDFSLGRSLVARKEQGIFLVPPMDFVPATERAAAEILVSAEEELNRYAQFGGSIMLKAFRAGLKEE